MADAVTRRFIYPPDWNENLPGQGVPIRNFRYGHKRIILHLGCVSDGTGETTITKLDISEIEGPEGKPIVRTVIEKIEYSVYGMGVTLYWERTPANIVITKIPGVGTGIHGTIHGPLLDPGTGDGTDGSGDILLTTDNPTAADSYDIILHIKLKEGSKPQGAL